LQRADHLEFVLTACASESAIRGTASDRIAWRGFADLAHPRWVAK
jgi:hypothetical protein